MKNLKYIFSILGGVFITGSIVFGATILFPTGGGTGQGTLPTGQLIYGNGLGKVGSVATTTVSCSGSASCTPFTVIGSSPITISATGGSGGSGNIATSAPGVISSLLYYTTGGATPEKVSPVATTTFTATPPIVLSNAISVIGSTPSVATCNVASGSQPGCLASADWTTFNNKLSSSLTKGNFLVGDDSGVAQATSTIFVTSIGNIGIGTTLPTAVNANARLTVAGISSQDIIASTTDNTTLSDAIIQAYAPGSRIFMGAHGTSQITSQYGTVVGGYGELAAINSSFGTSNGLMIGTRTTNTPIIFGTNSGERIRITGAGDVGIATSSPSGVLSIVSNSITKPSFVVQATTSQTGALADFWGATGSSLLNVQAGGNIGISSSSPASLLSVGGDAVGINFSLASTTFSTTGGINLTKGGCFAINNTCVGGGSFTNTLANGGTATTTFYNGGVVFSDASKLTQSASASNFFWDETNKRLGLGTSTPNAFVSINPNGIGSGIPIFLIGSTTRGLFDMSATGISTFRPMANAAGVFNVSQANGGSAVLSVDTNASVVNFNTMEGMTNASVKVYSNVQNNAGGTSVTLGNDPSNQKNPTTGVSQSVAIIDTQNASSGTGEVNHLEIRGVVGQTGTASGIIRGALITPTLNTATDYRALETAAYTFNLNISTTTLRSTLLNQFTIASTSATTVTNAYQQQTAGAPKASTNVTISTSTALFIGAGAVNGGGTVTKAYGLQVFAPTGATNNYSAQFTGDVQTAGGNPTLSSCGTSPSIRGTDTAGEVTVGSVAATGCTISFTTTKAFAPSCMVTEQTGSVVNAFSYTISTTAITVTQTGLTGIKLNYRCDQLTQ